MPQLLPGLPLPPPLTALEPDTWAQSTVQVRLREIAQRAIRENRFPPEVDGRYQALVDELPLGAIRPLEEPLAPDKEAWRNYIAPHLGRTWLEVPWFFAETYFYRRVLEATGFYQPGPMTGYDPFRIQKQLGEAASRDAIVSLRSKVDQVLREGNWRTDLPELLKADLWGNRVDLSLWPADQEGGSEDVHQSESFLLANDSEMVVEILSAPSDSHKRVDFVADNAGFELMVDLILGDYLLGTGLVGEVHYHLKAHPTFVSDATRTDFHESLVFLEETRVPALQNMVSRVRVAQAQGRIRLHADPFWTSPLPAWEMPEPLRKQISPASLVIIKGDANYRRLLGDLHWPFDTPFSKILAYFPAPLCALRTLKAEVAAGLRPEQVHRLDLEEPAWMTNGRWGVVQVAVR